jgi:CRISPR/Cas system endoribonuclease Cas6 (RAMP superfamily)
MSTPPSLATVLNKVLEAIQTILYTVADTIATNATTIATVVVLGALAFMVMRFGSRVFRGVMGWIRGLV